MTMTWLPLEPDVDSILASDPTPLNSLANGDTPAIVLRQAYEPDDGYALIQRFIDRDLMDDPATRDPGGNRKRIDIGTSLGNRGNDKDAFLEHANGTADLFSTLFEGYPDPVSLIYGTLTALGAGKQVCTAREQDGRKYGPAIFRIHYEGHRYRPHIDHVTLREKRFNYEVTRFTHQFAGVLCMQNTAPMGQATQSILHKCFWNEDIQPHIDADTFYDYAEKNGVPNFQVDLEPGDLYFFNTGLIHEVPALEGDDPRVVLAVFIGYSEEEDEIYVWS
ncbi:MAG: hypothetical protein CME19_15465 [Gemmatimonadetes bacterium]|nr:hypothetical protein [Gemmatimonadota bacterium]